MSEDFVLFHVILSLNTRTG